MIMNQDVCKNCGNDKEFITGIQSGYAAISFTLFKNRRLNHVVCLKCGTIVRSFVNKPEKLVQKNSKYEC